MERLGPDSLLIVWGGPSTADPDREEPAAENLYYLTGTTQSDSILVLMPGNVTKRKPCSSAHSTRGASTGMATR